MRQTLDLPENFENYTEARKKGFIRMHELKKQGKQVVGTFCSYTPNELVLAAGAVPVGLCGSSEEGIAEAEARLPKNLCPLIKSSYGLAASDKCPYFYFSDMVLAETTCDGKKKMYEMLGEIKPVHVMQLPPGREGPGALEYWRLETIRAKEAIEKNLGVTITEDAVRAAIKTRNRQRRALLALYDTGKLDPCPLSGYELSTLAEATTFMFTPEEVINALEEKARTVMEKYGEIQGGEDDRPRILVTGCPLTGVRDKIIRQAEELGAVVVAFDSCSGPRAQRELVDEDPNKDPYLALAEKYLNIDCSVMSPNPGRLESLREMIEEYRVDGVIEVILTACHTFACEADSVSHLVNKELGLPYVAVETDYSQTDRGQLGTRIGALLEIIPVKV